MRQNQSSAALGAWGGNLGYSGIAPSVGVEVDTYERGVGTILDDDTQP